MFITEDTLKIKKIWYCGCFFMPTMCVIACRIYIQISLCIINRENILVLYYYFLFYYFH